LPFADRIGLAALLTFAGLLRAFVLWNYGAKLAEDNDQYRAIAQEVVAGRGFSDPETQLPTAYRPPLYPLLIAGILVSGGGNLTVGFVQLALGVATVGFTYLAGRRLGLGRASFIAGLLVALDPLLLYQTALVMTETTAAFLAAVVLWLCSERPGRLRSFGFGVALGMCCLCRPTFWAFAAVAAVVWGILYWRRESRSNLPSSTGRANGGEVDAMGPPPSPPATLPEGEGRSEHDCWRNALATLAGIALVIAPWALRNAVVTGWPIVTTTHGGYTLLLAHNPAYTRAVVEQPWGSLFEGAAFDEWSAGLEADMARENPPIDSSHLSPAAELARDRWMNEHAWKYIREEPGTAVRAGLTLLGRFWNLTPFATERTPVSKTMRIGVAAFYVAVTVALLAGFCRRSRADWLRWWPAAALIVSFSLVHSLYWADMRMRTPVVPAIALFAAVCIRPRGNPGDNV